MKEFYVTGQTLTAFSVIQEHSDYCVIHRVLGTTQQTTTTGTITEHSCCAIFEVATARD